jgi:hypothetical protein
MLYKSGNVGERHIKNSGRVTLISSLDTALIPAGTSLRRLVMAQDDKPGPVSAISNGIDVSGVDRLDLAFTIRLVNEYSPRIVF